MFSLHFDEYSSKSKGKIYFSNLHNKEFQKTNKCNDKISNKKQKENHSPQMARKSIRQFKCLKQKLKFFKRFFVVFLNETLFSMFTLTSRTQSIKTNKLQKEYSAHKCELDS